MVKIHNDEFVEYVIELLEQFDTIKVRKMFGGYGLYANHRIFSLIINGRLYFKANTETSKFFAQFSSEQFTYDRNGKIVKVSYWSVPAEVLENHELLEQWFNASLTNFKKNL